MRNRINIKIDVQTIIMAGCVFIAAYLALIPLGMLLFKSFRSVPSTGQETIYYTLKNYLDAYLDSGFLPLLRNSIIYGIGVCLTTFVLGTTMAWIYERTNTPLKRIFGIMALVPFIIPGILSTVSWMLLLSPKIGLINLWVVKLFGLENAPFNIYSLPGMIWAEGIHLYPLVFLMMSSAFRSMDMALEEAGTMSGSGNFSTFFRITLPVMRPAFFSAMLIMFIRAIEAFAVPALIGIPAGIEMFTSRIYMAFRSYPPNFGLASSLAVTLLIISVIGVYFYRRVTRNEKRFATVSGKGYRPRVIDLGSAKYVVSGLCVVFFIITVGLPLLILLWSSLVSFYKVPSFSDIPNFSFQNYIYLLKYPTTFRAFRNSIILMLSTATVTMLLTSVIAWIAVKSKMKGRGFLDVITFIPIAIPGIVLGVSLMYVYLTLPIPIYGTIWILFVAYTTKYMPYGIRTTTATIIQIHSELEEASALSGASWIYTFVKIIIPMLIPGFMAGWIYIAMVSLRELSTSILLYGHGSEVLSIVVMQLWSDGEYQTVCALGIVMILLLALLAVVSNMIGNKIGIKRVE
ncbi:MAG: iron ABC transporter permease [Desulfobacterales bacterium]|nr:iron ABC transporter permease [Desulfobacterales bacterium]